MTSYGLLVYYQDIRNGEIWYHVSQRRDTIAYIKFLQGKVPYDKLPKYFSLMTALEKERLFNHSFEDLYRDLTSTEFTLVPYSNPLRYRESEMESSRIYFNNLRNSGVLNTLLNDSKKDILLDWGIPKGRKKHPDEPNLVCALREYKEETHNKSYIEILDIPPISDDLKIFESKIYRNFYFVARSKFQPRPRYIPNLIRRSTISEETNDIEWATLERCRELLPSSLYNIIKAIDQRIKSENIPFISLKDGAVKYDVRSDVRSDMRSDEHSDRARRPEPLIDNAEDIKEPMLQTK